MTGAPAEWWQWFALLGPVAAPLIIAAATLTAAGVAASIALRTLRQRDLADRRAEWWRSTQWAFDAIESGVSSRRQLGLGVMEVLAESELPSTEEVGLWPERGVPGSAPPSTIWTPKSSSRTMEAAMQRARARMTMIIPPRAAPKDGAKPRVVHMTKDELREQILAARLRVTTDKRLGLETPEWVKDLAKLEI
ncbi:hypothetical protein [Sinomonas cellulolyticus]|uniref:Uncharacterized protein n=2 Tax=Sinomonas TaxID=596707 RepID=A0ABS1K2Z5_9MICC|nr:MULTISPECIES: hypothetical protein [Sinomonas]MBL0705297.1 hypothetical protein [Sinomonas cellulolyticus]